LLAHSQYLHPTVIQISAITSAYGLSFLIVLVNSAITAVILPLVVRLTNSRIVFPKTLWNRQVLAIIGSASMAIAVTLLYGYLAISPPVVGEKVKLSVIQPNIEQKKKWNPKFENFIMKTLTDLSFRASKDRPQLIIWPETATPRAITENYGLFKQIQEISKKTDATLLLGSSERQKYHIKNRSDRKYMNSAFLIQPSGSKGKNQRYDKIRLLPFAEYLPYKEKIPWSYAKIPDIDGYVPGENFTVFKHDNFAFSTTICWENIYPQLVRSFVKEGAQFIVNISNEAWFGKTAAPYQFLSMSVFRAVENRIFVVRSGNTGVSCIIDPYGRIVNRVTDNGGQDLFVRGFLTGSITLYGLKSFYTKFGDIFVYISLVISAFFLIFSFFNFQDKKRKPLRNE